MSEMEKRPSFEKSVARLDEIVARLEKGDVTLDNALAMFEEGTALVKQCAGLLDTAEQKVMLLTRGNEVDSEPWIANSEER